MRAYIKRILIIAGIGAVCSCGSKDDPQPALPSYLHVPATLSGYTGSGLITITGGSLNLRAEGPETLDASSQTYQGVTGEISDEDINANFTVGQPRPYKERQIVPAQYRAYGYLTVINTITPGTYPMNAQAPSPRGEFADLTLNLPGPQLYLTNSGSLTIDESTLIKSQGSTSLYRVKGTFQAVMFADGIGIPANQQNPTLTGTFDLLLVKD